MSGVPVINERLFNWVLGDPHRRDLRTLWQAGEKLLYLPQPGKHFDSVAGKVEFDGIRFTDDALGHVLRERWNPAKDINLGRSWRLNGRRHKDIRRWAVTG